MDRLKPVSNSSISDSANLPNVNSNGINLNLVFPNGLVETTEENHVAEPMVPTRPVEYCFKEGEHIARPNRWPTETEIAGQMWPSSSGSINKMEQQNDNSTQQQQQKKGQCQTLIALDPGRNGSLTMN
ncbi:hypothetical protein BLOT_009760 [Blomia tropicalis]|nr:hypothetical protein BLOT_009760 [Blomia tropicalis]